MLWSAIGVFIVILNMHHCFSPVKLHQAGFDLDEKVSDLSLCCCI